MHKENCTINKNTKELRNKLIELGWKITYLIEDEDNVEDSIVCQLDEKLGDMFFTCNRRTVEKDFLCVPQVIDCGNNEELFLAIAALQDDSDYMQWFVFDDDIKFDGEILHKNGEFMLHEKKDNALHSDLYHKATVEELINHFRMFTQDCFVYGNSRDLIHFIMITDRKIDANIHDWGYLACIGDEFKSIPTPDEFHISDSSIDCGENLNLFAALAVLRNDNDLKQFFVVEEDNEFFKKGDYIQCNKDKWEDFIKGKKILAHKATVEELIKHFKK